MYKVEEELIKDILIKKIKVETKDIKITLLSYGAILMDLETKNCQGDFESVVLGWPNIEDYLVDEGAFGCNVGRVAGRISNHKFTLNNTDYEVDSNSNGNTLHGGFNNLTKRNFDSMYIEEKDSENVIFSTIQKSAYDNFPGDLNVKITYKISKIDGSVKVIYDAISNKDTLVNITNHSYFNLRGNYDSSILEHNLQIKAPLFFEEDDKMIPTKVLPVTKVMDFQEPKAIGTDIESPYLTNHPANGYDHYYRFAKTDNNLAQICLKDSLTKRSLTIYTTYPGVVLYSFNYPMKNTIMNHNIPSSKNMGVALECQYAPDSINNKFYNEGVLKANTPYHEEICYKFEVDC